MNNDRLFRNDVTFVLRYYQVPYCFNIGPDFHYKFIQTKAARMYSYNFEFMKLCGSSLPYKFFVEYIFYLVAEPNEQL